MIGSNIRYEVGGMRHEPCAMGMLNIQKKRIK